MADLMHDFDVVSRISSLIGTMRSSYEGLSTEVTSQIMGDIQRAIRYAVVVASAAAAAAIDVVADYVVANDTIVDDALAVCFCCGC